MTTQPIVLVVDDEKSLRDSMQMLLKDNYNVLLAKNSKEALQLAKKNPIDLVLLDIRLPEVDGIEVLKQLKSLDSSIEVIMVTAVMTVGKAVEAIRLGAYDYLTKPFDIQALQEQAAKALEKRKLQQENFSLRKIIEDEFQFEKIVGKSEGIKAVFKSIEDVAESNATVLITGESGTGKELVARAIHNRSLRKENLFVAVNCAAIPDNLLESELFGHEKGSFTGAIGRQIGKFELANGGTLFLDEVGSLPFPMQAKLLRVIQSREIERIGGSRPQPIDVRLISATNSNLLEEIKKRNFREDLFYRLNVVPIHIPPLRERKKDIPLLANHFLNKYNHEFNKKIKGFNKDVLPLLIAHDWPGNVRELENLIERLVVLTREDLISAEKLPEEIKLESTASDVPSKLKFHEAVKNFEIEFIRQALEMTGGKKAAAAKLIGVHRNTIRNVANRYKN